MKIYLLIMLLSSLLSAWNCGYNKYPLLQKDGWNIRIDEQAEIYGCSVIPLYDYLVKNDAIKLMDVMDENPQITEYILKLFSNKSILKILNQNKLIKELIFSNDTNNGLFFKNFSYLIEKKYNSAITKQINMNPIYLNYYILPSIVAKNSKELYKYYNSLKRLNLQELKLFSSVYGVLGNDYRFSDLLQNFSRLKKRLSSHQLEQLVFYPQFIAYFLYPSKEDMNFNGDEKTFRKKQKEFQELTISIYKSVYQYYRTRSGNVQANISGNVQANIYALLTVKEIFPYTVENYNNYYEIGKLFDLLVKQGFIANLWGQIGDKCKKTTRENLFAVFTENNLINLLTLKAQENDLYKQIIYYSSKKEIQIPIYVANSYTKLNAKEWKVFKDLILHLNGTMYKNVWRVGQLDSIGYFSAINQMQDYNQFIIKDDDVDKGKSTSKYKFILLTSYPSDYDLNVITYLDNGNIKQAKENLTKLYRISKNDLETHNFTTFEKGMAMANTADNVITVVAILAAIPTLGASLGAEAAYKVSMEGLKYGGKRLVKYEGKQVGKRFVKYEGKQVGKSINEKGIQSYEEKIMYRSTKSVRIPKSRIFKKFGNRNAKNFERDIDNLNDTISSLKFGAKIGAGVAGYFMIPQNLQAKNICQGE